MTRSEKAKVRRNPKPIQHEDIPKKKLNGITFFPVPDFSDSERAFGADGKHYFNRMDIPQVPRKFEEMVNGWFFSSGTIPEFHSAVDRTAATRAIRALFGSFAPPHEAKIATVAYAVWLWTHPTALD